MQALLSKFEIVLFAFAKKCVSVGTSATPAFVPTRSEFVNINPGASLLTVFDFANNLHLFIDSFSTVSLLPCSHADCPQPLPDFSLKAASVTPISAYNVGVLI